MILAGAFALLPLAVCSLWRNDRRPAADLLRLEAERGTNGSPSFPRTLKLPGSISHRAMVTRDIQVIPDLTSEAVAAERTIASQRSLISLLCVPVAAEGPDPSGVLHFYTGVRHSFSAIEIHVADALARQVGIVWHMAVLKDETRRAKAALATRKRVDRAKEILMDQRGMSAEEAYRWIQKRSMDSRRSMREVAETIILSVETGHYTSIPHALDLLGKPSCR